MHFSKEYSQLLNSLPESLSANPIHYGQLKKLINEIVHELAAFGLNPTILRDLQQTSSDSNRNINDTSTDVCLTAPNYDFAFRPLKVAYEFDGNGQPLLRLSVNTVDSPADSDVERFRELEIDDPTPAPSITDVSTGELLEGGEGTADSRTSEQPIPVQVIDKERTASSEDLTTSSSSSATTDGTHEVVITLVSDATFVQLLSTALQSLSAHIPLVQSNFLSNLDHLSKDISSSARPMSSISSFRPHSATSDPRSVQLPLFVETRFKWSESDLYLWREIFQVYIDSSPFESISERDRGQRTLTECEERLRRFAEKVTKRGLERKMKMKQSRDALGRFLELNVFIMNLRKFQYANAEAVRKILKKHKKRTSLAMPPSLFLSAAGTIMSTQSTPPDLCLVPTSLPRILVQAIGEVLIPVIPHLDDYSCLICTALAFKPIRLSCGHLFCVRCLVKMQRAGKGNCPLCRASTVLDADRSNVDWALMNFMKDWFPVEAKAKIRQNHQETAEDEVRDMGLDPGRCVLM